ncbi:sorting nexin-10-like [Lampetra planeri]
MPRAMENAKEDFVEVRVRDPQIQDRNSWHPHVDYEIFLHTNSISFTRKVSCTRRRFREFVWLRKCLEKSTNLEQLPDLPPRNLFFSCYNENDVEMRRQGLQNFLHRIVKMVIVLSDSRLHLFLQSRLSVSEMDACVSGLTSFSVHDAIMCQQRAGCRFPMEEPQPQQPRQQQQEEEEENEVASAREASPPRKSHPDVLAMSTYDGEGEKPCCGEYDTKSEQDSGSGSHNNCLE